MRIESLKLDRFKKFRQSPRYTFAPPDAPGGSSITVLVGPNGSGKSTILQALAASLGTATRRIRSPKELNWPGFNPELLNSAWPGPYEASVEVRFSRDECTNVTALYQEFAALSQQTGLIPPDQSELVRLSYREGQVRAQGGHKQFLQFMGREYAKYLYKAASKPFSVFEQVGTVLWYTEHRTSTSLTPDSDTEDSDVDGKSMEFTEENIRRQLNNLFMFHQRVEDKKIELRAGQRDIMGDFERYYRHVFRTRGLRGTVPRNRANELLFEPWFQFYDDSHEYEISELSGAERALFPILLDFANWNIHNSVILIDEVELHLHPPIQQRFISQLRNLGSGNQFILTTHSDWVLEILSDEQIIRLEGGDSQ